MFFGEGRGGSHFFINHPGAVMIIISVVEKSTRPPCLVINDSAHIENHCAPRHADGLAERAGAGIIEIGDVIDRATATTCGVLAEAFGAGKGG